MVEKIGPIFSSFDAIFSKLTKKNLWRENSFDILDQEVFRYENEKTSVGSGLTLKRGLNPLAPISAVCFPH